MEFFGALVEWLYRAGAALLFGYSQDGAVQRVIIIGLVFGMIGILPLSVAVLLWAAYVTVFAFWNPSLREISGFYFRMTALLCFMLSVVWLGRNLIA